jgi:hypothetical protein
MNVHNGRGALWAAPCALVLRFLRMLFSVFEQPNI